MAAESFLFSSQADMRRAKEFLSSLFHGREMWKAKKVFSAFLFVCSSGEKNYTHHFFLFCLVLLLLRQRHTGFWRLDTWRGWTRCCNKSHILQHTPNIYGLATLRNWELYILFMYINVMALKHKLARFLKPSHPGDLVFR